MFQKEAKITSVEELEIFHKKMLLFTEESLAILEKIRCEINRRQQLLKNDLEPLWKREYTKWKVKMTDAHRQSNAQGVTSGRVGAAQMYRLAKEKAQNAQKKIELIKQWKSRLQHELAALQIRLLKLKLFVTSDFQRAAHLIKEHSDTLHQYTHIVRPAQ